MENRSEPDWLFYEVKVSARSLPYLAIANTPGFPKSFRQFKYAPSIALRPGDFVALTIFESGGSSLFAPPTTYPTQAVTTNVPVQVVEPDGRLMVPFAGPLVVAGSTPLQVSEVIARKLARETIKPQVVVSIISNGGSNTASVGGDVNKAGPMPLTLRGERVLDAIDYATGVKYPLTEMDIRLIRGHSAVTVPLEEIMRNPEQNVRIRPNDEIIAIHNARTFSVLGAGAKVAQYNFDTPNVTLAEAIARAGGPVDTIGDPEGVFVFRREPTGLALQVLDTVATPEDFISSAGQPVTPTELVGPTIMMAYRIDLNTPDGYFIAQKMQIRDKDVILITDAVGTQLQKLTTIVRGFTGTLFDLGASGALK